MLSFLWARRPQAGPRRRGGHRQRLAASADDIGVVDAPAAPSELFAKLLLQWADGNLPASTLQDLAASGQRDRFVHPMIERFATMGAAQHSHSGLMNMLLTDGELGGLIDRVPGCEAKSLMLPSRWIHTLHQYPHEFRPLLGASRAKLRYFWEHFLAQPGNAGVSTHHPAVAGLSLDGLECMIPLAVHVDAAPIHKDPKCDLCQLQQHGRSRR